MFARFALAAFLMALAVGFTATAQDKKSDEKKPEEKKKDEPRKGTVTGVVTAKDANSIEVKADGEEKARKYVPQWKGGLPKDGGGFDKDILAAIKETPLNSRVKLDWEFQERPRVVKLEVLKKAEEKKDK